MLILLLIPFLLLELYLSLKVGEKIGFVWSAVWIVVTMAIGIRLLQSTPFTMMQNLDSVAKGKLSMKGFGDAATAYFIGAVLLIIPGVLSDILGVIALSYAVYLQFIAKITPEQQIFDLNQPYKGEENVIDAEIIDEHTDHKRVP
ncbi:MAG: FxsA family protein [Campylobacterales bacterium]|nr:FxsA family protein [Campylobacterales bacterium]